MKDSLAMLNAGSESYNLHTVKSPESAMPYCWERFPTVELSESYHAYEENPDQINSLMAQDEEIWDYYKQMHPYEFEGDE
jgi:hypothetical protein